MDGVAAPAMRAVPHQEGAHLNSPRCPSILKHAWHVTHGCAIGPSHTRHLHPSPSSYSPPNPLLFLQSSPLSSYLVPNRLPPPASASSSTCFPTNVACANPSSFVIIYNHPKVRFSYLRVSELGVGNQVSRHFLLVPPALFFLLHKMPFRSAILSPSPKRRGPTSPRSFKATVNRWHDACLDVAITCASLARSLFTSISLPRRCLRDSHTKCCNKFISNP
jgi:hypothetical protein